MANKTTTGKKSTATKKQSSTKKNTTKSTGAKTKTKNVTVEAEVIDVAKVEAIKEVFLWLFLAVCVLLFLSNLGIGGAVGNAVSGFFFGILGLIAYSFDCNIFWDFQSWKSCGNNQIDCRWCRNGFS